jgi:hypothetical protein
MKRKSVKIIVSLVIIFAASCGEPETVVTNYVHPDGSVTRKLEIRSGKKIIKQGNIQVPLDSTWSIRDSFEINGKGDTTWVKRAEKQFKNVEEINLAYNSDSSSDNDVKRQAGFKKSFKWFNTEYRYSEKIDKKFLYGYPIKDFLNNEELVYFYSPESLKHKEETGPDSIKYKALKASLSEKTDNWTYKNLVSEWIGLFSGLTAGKRGNDFTEESLKSKENEILDMVKKNSEKFDSLWSNGYILKEIIGESNAIKYKAEADSAIKTVEANFLLEFKNYSVRIVMPGKLLGTNGFIDSSHILLWPVESDYFLTEPYEMWAESKTPNIWIWIVSGLFLGFVITGIIMRVIKKD